MFHNIKKVLAIACVTVAVGAATLPSLVSAQNTTTQTQSETRKPRKGNNGWAKLNLTDTQKAQLKTIRENAKTQTQSVLTAEQRAQIEQARKSGDRKGVRKSLNLTDAQKQQMKTIAQSTKEQIKNVLTPAQQQQLEQMKQERKANRPTR
ncbi:MAG: hypothetical protein DCF19_11165 [Pseudanabaena frigida]|uniref:P pilus assembly/Cpx signaling pathway, periplasmic inhibitor/zinc-resistance associated protein n=1 Tax=Pseudanabaena frigida TaxID=945775 RepID=A0A2W4Y1M7_9CYAN|nr:MAG: hypothetical protein DCF19_11165 [Pseudanabaena frigida]